MCRSIEDGGRRCAFHSSPEYRDKENARRRLKYAKEREKPLSDVLYARHLEYAYTTTEHLIHNNGNTVDTHAEVNEHGQLIWSDERLAAHQEVLNHFTSQWVNIPQENKAVVSGGLAGGGKTSTLENHAGLDMNHFVMLSPDEIKEVMAEKGLFPHIPGLTPMEASAVAYEEATHLTNMLLSKATKDNYNLIYDTTMGSVGATVSKLQPMKDAGYDIHAVFIDIQVDTSLRRSQERHRKGLNAYLTEGIGHGGRLLPRRAVTSQRSDDPRVSSKNVLVFEELEKDNWFASTMMFDNNIDGASPRRIR